MTSLADALVANHESQITNHHDVVIAGASFAGLAVAQRLRGKRVVLLDRAPVGDGVTSACGAPVSIVRAMGAETSIQLVHDRLVLHTRAGETVWPLPEPFCTFDYRRFFELAVAHAGGEVIPAAGLGGSGSTPPPPLGGFSWTLLVGAPRGRGALARGARLRDADRR